MPFLCCSDSSNLQNDKNNLQKENLLLQSFEHQGLQQTSWKIRIFASKEMDFSDDKHPVSREIRADLTFLIKSEIDDRDVLFFLTTQPMAIALNHWQFRIDTHILVTKL